MKDLGREELGREELGREELGREELSKGNNISFWGLLEFMHIDLILIFRLIRRVKDPVVCLITTVRVQ